MRETVQTNRDWRAHWASVSLRSPKNELLRQVERTSGGEPVPQNKIDLLVRDVTHQLDLGCGDILLDLCCGNGLITYRLSPRCRAVVAADFSAELIEVARERHAYPNTTYLHRAADELLPADFPQGPPTKVSMISGMQHFTVAMADRLLQSLSALAKNNMLVFFTEVPDAGKLDVYYNTPKRWAEFEQRRAAGTEPIGTWWNRDHLRSLITAAGYTVSIIDPIPDRSAAHYRFDVLARLGR